VTAATVIVASLAAFVVGCSGCSKSASRGPAENGGGAAMLPADAAVPERSAELDEMWARAKDGEEDDLVRLARREGVTGLEDRGAHPVYRATAARALGFTDGYGALPWLAQVGTSDDPDALAALEGAVTLATQARRQRDPDDAEDLRTGCDKLLAFAKDAAAPRPKRVLAVRALRMLKETGAPACGTAPGAIPTDVDSRAGQPPADAAAK
jgi:hypothetical protein